MDIDGEIVEKVYSEISKSSNPLAMIGLAEMGEFKEIKGLHEILKDLDENGRKVILSGMKVVFKESFG